MKRFTILACLSALFTLSLTFADVSPAFACSGGAPLTISGLLENSDYLVKAHPVEIDDAGQNYVLQVESYLAGGAGSEFLLYSQLDPRLVQYIHDGRSSGGDCLGFGAGIDYGDTFYAFLRRNLNGSYSGGTYHFYSPDSTVEVYLDDSEDETIPEGFADRGSGIQVTEDEFLNVIREEVGDDSVTPLENSSYPRKAPLTITTQSGQDYLFPIDTSTPVEITPELGEELRRANPIFNYDFGSAGSCETEGCVQYSPDGTNISVQDEDETITFTYGYSVNGQASLFSSTSDAIAVWQECFLTVYSLGIPRLGQAWHQPEVVNVASLNFNIQARCTDYANLAAWSPDGRLLAYSDNDGLWLWDVFTFNEAPELLIPTENDIIPLARYFSPLGRYLAVTVQGENQTLDLVSGDFYADGVISPDDRLLLQYNTDAEFSSAQICSFTPYTCEPLLYMELSRYDEDEQRVQIYTLDQVAEVEWTNNYEYIVRSCNVEDLELCAYLPQNQWNATAFRSYVISEGYAHDYDALNDSLAIVRDGETLYINGDILDLSDMLDSEIISVEWGYSLFYRE
ncbi:MAG: hypothetical protein RLP44_15705 [Aggregatilineales bacterium]